MDMTWERLTLTTLTFILVEGDDKGLKYAGRKDFNSEQDRFTFVWCSHLFWILKIPHIYN